MQRSIIAALLLTLILSGCRNTNEYEIPPTGYNIYLDGRLISGEPMPAEYSYAFYLPQGMETKFRSNALSAEEAVIYNTILEQAGGFADVVPMIGDGSHYWMLYIMWAEQLGFPHVEKVQAWDYVVNSPNPFTVKYVYRFTAKEVSEMNRAAEVAADTIMAGVTGSMSDYDKLKYFHDYLIKNCISDIEDAYADTIYGTLVRKKALCEGYTKAFSYLCNRAGIENMIVYGRTDIDHMWNMVKLDGNWYHIDVTWNSPGLQDYPDAVLYNYFMVTDAVIENTHTIWRDIIDPPRAYSNKENYFVRDNRGRYAVNADDFMTVTAKALTQAVENRESAASIKFESAELYAAGIEMLKGISDGLDTLRVLIDEISRELDVVFEVNYTENYSEQKILVFLIRYD
ncbi:MAG: hypothetical protein FWG90_09725 [Oscillospiraceae bacterium]|nr:hypothetical protein [Oscillospiraceae bacterium]